MLIRFRVQNHRSIRDEQELSLVAAPLSEHPESLVRAERYDIDLLRVAAIYGANASGKSTVFDALSFMRAAVEDSHRSWKPDGGIPRTPFALDPEAVAEPSRFAVDLLLDGIRYEYGFAVSSARVLEEWLFAYPKGRRQEWFTRDAAREEEFAFSRLLPGENRAISALTRPNSLFLSAAAQNNHPSLVPLFSWFSRTLEIADDQVRNVYPLVLAALCKKESFRAAVLNWLQSADLGIVGIDLVGPRQSDIQFRHESGSSGEDILLPFESESQGTRTLFVLAALVLNALARGETLAVDELDRSLHPHLAIQIVSVFNDPATNPLNAQLIFNTHDTNLLDRDHLRRDQIWFTEKGDDGATRLFPLTDFRARKYENLERGYLQGRYGAVPSVRTPDLRLVAEG